MLRGTCAGRAQFKPVEKASLSHLPLRCECLGGTVQVQEYPTVLGARFRVFDRAQISLLQLRSDVQSSRL